jgi:acyl-homoserine lactone acylase PvdQ
VTDRVNGYDNGYRLIPDAHPENRTREYLEGYVKGVNDQLTDKRGD